MIKSKNLLFWCGILILIFISIKQGFAEILVEDDFGIHRFEQVPSRVIVLNWDLLEQVLALEVVPIAAPNLNGYHTWVVEPTAPNSILDIGTRSEPNLEKIARLKPDLILAAAPQKKLIPILKQIAPVLYLPNFEENQDAAQTAINHFKKLSQLFNKEKLAQQKLKELDGCFARLQRQIIEHFSKNLSVLVMRFSTPNTVFLMTENSTTNYVINQLGLSNPINLPARAWGIKQDRINKLQHLNNSYVLYVRPFPEESKLVHSALWQVMPFVKHKRVNAVRPVWSYGGVLSLQFMANAITQSLLELAVEQ